MYVYTYMYLRLRARLRPRSGVAACYQKGKEPPLELNHPIYELFVRRLNIIKDIENDLRHPLVRDVTQHYVTWGGGGYPVLGLQHAVLLYVFMCWYGLVSVGMCCCVRLWFVLRVIR